MQKWVTFVVLEFECIKEEMYICRLIGFLLGNTH